MRSRFARLRVTDAREATELVRKLPTYLRLVWGLLRDPRVPLRQKGLLALVVGYLVAPFDLIPDFIPILGQVDDIAVTLLVVDLFIRGAPREIVDEHLARIARNEDVVREDLAQAQRLLGEGFTRIRDNLERILERTGSRARPGRDAFGDWTERAGRSDGARHGEERQGRP